jgi:DNA invertase Pin-like site-specific DNA recombinase
MIKALRVGLYLRVSTDEQTVENQRIDLMRVAEQRGWLVTEYVDHAISGRKGRDKRPAFDRICKDAQQGKLDMIAAWALDRIGRSQRDVINLISDLPLQGVQLYLHKEQIDTATPVGKLLGGIMAAVAEMETARLTERIRAGIARAKRAGIHCGRKSEPLSAKTQTAIRAQRAKGTGICAIAKQFGVGVNKVTEALERAA